MCLDKILKYSCNHSEDIYYNDQCTCENFYLTRLVRVRGLCDDCVNASKSDKPLLSDTASDQTMNSPASTPTKKLVYVSCTPAKKLDRDSAPIKKPARGDKKVRGPVPHDPDSYIVATPEPQMCKKCTVM